MIGYCPYCKDYVDVVCDELVQDGFTEPYCLNCNGDVYRYDEATETVGAQITAEDVADYYAPD